MAITDWLSNNWIEIFGAVAGIVYVFLEIRQNLWLWPVGIVTSAVYIWVFFTNKIYADMSLQGYYLVISFLGWYWWTKGGGQGAKGEGHARSKATQFRDSGRAQSAGRETRSAVTKFREAKVGERETRSTAKRGDAVPQSGRAQGTRSEAESRESGGHTRSEATQFREAEGEERAERTGGTEGLVVTKLKLKTGIILTMIFSGLFSLVWFVLSEWTDSPVPGWDSFITSLSIVATWMLARKIYEHWFLWIVVNTVSAILFITRGLYPTVVLYIIYGIMSFAGLKAWKRTLST